MKPSDFNPDYQNTHMESKIVVALERISQAFRVLLWQECKEYGLSPIQMQMLIFLLHHDPEKRIVSYLAREFHMTRATISDSIKSLEDKKLIKKERSPEDSRSHLIHLSQKGKRLAERTSSFTQAMRKPIEGLPEGEKERLWNSLLDVIHHLQASGIISIQRMCLTCIYFQPGERGEENFCRLLHQPLPDKSLRIDCPEHEMSL